MVAYVYLLEEIPFQPDESGPWTKIGYSQNPPEWRVNANLKRGNPRTLRLSAVFEFDTEKDAFNAEQAAHAKFRRFDHEREWFKVAWGEVATWLRDQGFRERSSSVLN
jgi:hypothetical protein